MAINGAFAAMGKTYKANATTSSQTITITPDGPCNQILVANHQATGSGGQPVYFLVSSNSSITVTAPANNSVIGMSFYVDARLSPSNIGD